MFQLTRTEGVRVSCVKSDKGKASEMNLCKGPVVREPDLGNLSE